MKNLILSAIFGLTALLLVNLVSVYTGVELVVSKLSLLVAAILGIPGVITMLMMNIVL
ncbi:pro-sigmaK processing inhibitor BofA family protein [Scatolibacter rhodanostii]|uniref:pro-sigmaK processing inhibitor BofA family protein n=1 Tax=Scatolibacter rhodanostii TaxID=2014781 RepID=UPI0013565E33|nr:pro-sigmaK processing inhibitor BofA family protein [Scatolibacter rhodanostii]